MLVALVATACAPFVGPRRTPGPGSGSTAGIRNHAGLRRVVSWARRRTVGVHRCWRGQACETPRTKRNNLFRALLLSNVAILVAPVASHAQNLIINGGFTTNGGDSAIDGAPPWAAVGNGYVICTTLDCGGKFPTVSPYNGVAFAALPAVTSGGATQAVNLAKSGGYQFSFFYN